VNAAPEADQVMKAQELRDMRAARDDLERRVHDLRLTRQVTMQSLPSIRLVQENDKSLVTKINSTLVNTVPLWETQLAQAVTIQRSAEAARAVKEASDLTNELLTANAANLRESNKMVREEMERGVFDIEAIKANADLVATIEESLQIADEGKARRAAAEEELVKWKPSCATRLPRPRRAAMAAPAGTAPAGKLIGRCREAANALGGGWRPAACEMGADPGPARPSGRTTACRAPPSARGRALRLLRAGRGRSAARGLLRTEGGGRRPLPMRGSGARFRRDRLLHRIYGNGGRLEASRSPACCAAGRAGAIGLCSAGRARRPAAGRDARPVAALHRKRLSSCHGPADRLAPNARRQFHMIFAMPMTGWTAAWLRAMPCPTCPKPRSLARTVRNSRATSTASAYSIDRERPPGVFTAPSC
jgi:hypothetical protein